MFRHLPIMLLLVACSNYSPEKEMEMDNKIMAALNKARAECNSRHEDNLFLMFACQKGQVMAEAQKIDYPDTDLLEEYFDMHLDTFHEIADGNINPDEGQKFIDSETIRITAALKNRSQQRYRKHERGQRMAQAIALGFQQYGQQQSNFYQNQLNNTVNQRSITCSTQTFSGIQRTNCY